MQKIVPHLWYDKEAMDAASFYVSLFPNSSINFSTVIKDTPGGDSEQVGFTLAGLDFMAISAGPDLKLNPSVSLYVNCSTVEEVDELYEQLAEGGGALMELDSYPFSQRYAWVVDRFGLSWQLSYSEVGFTQKIIPSLLFSGEYQGKAEEAIKYYRSVFAESSLGVMSFYEEIQGTDRTGQVAFSLFTLEDIMLSAMDSGVDQPFSFTPAFSLIVMCDNQEEIDYYWEKLSAVPEAEQCGWLQDKFGVSWQITPRILDEMLLHSDEEKKQRVVECFLKMKKLDIAELQRAFQGQ